MFSEIVPGGQIEPQKCRRIHVSAIWGQSGNPRGGPKRPQGAPKSAQEAIRRPSRPLRGQELSGGIPGSSGGALSFGALGALWGLWRDIVWPYVRFRLHCFGSFGLRYFIASETRMVSMTDAFVFDLGPVWKSKRGPDSPPMREISKQRERPKSPKCASQALEGQLSYI